MGYVTEVRSGRLEWRPVHRSEKFWRENAAKPNDKNYELLRILITLLESTKEPLVLSVACFDLGEYVRHYQRGKHVLETLGGKTMVMALLSHDDPNVRYEALLAVQKLMVHNWEYLGRQVENPGQSRPQGELWLLLESCQDSVLHHLVIGLNEKKFQYLLRRRLAGNIYLFSGNILCIF